MMTKPHTESLVVRYVARRSVAFIQLFALYVVAHGEDGPGGGLAPLPEPEPSTFMQEDYAALRRRRSRHTDHRSTTFF